MQGLAEYSTYIFLAAGVLGGVVLLFIVWKVLGNKKPKYDPDAGLNEDLSEYPPAPKAGTHQLLYEGQPVRIRLVVLAPSGRSVDLKPSMAEGLLESVLPGLGSVAQLDKPRVRVWPPQMSLAGFAPTFFRHVSRPEPHGKPSRWILAAGPAKAGTKPILIGLALDSQQPSTRGNVSLDLEKWPEVFRVKVVE